MRWHGHVGCKGDIDWAKSVEEWNVTVGRMKRTWQNTVFADMRLLGVDPLDV